jgi:hypothetical protein
MKRSVRNYSSLFFTALFALVLMAGCQCNSGNKDSIKKENIEAEVREFVYPLPTSFEVTEMLNRIEASYIIDLSNSPANVDKYLSEQSRALNLGVYSSDLSYASTYNQQQFIVDYMTASRKLIESLEMTAAVDPELPKKIEQNENNKDELIKLITESFYDTYDYLNRNGRAPVSALVITGSFVEALYIATNISDNTFNNKEMVKIVMTQKEPLQKLMDLLNKYSSTEYVKNTISEITPLHDIFKSIDEGGITESQLELIKQEVKNIRTRIVS